MYTEDTGHVCDSVVKLLVSITSTIMLCQHTNRITNGGDSLYSTTRNNHDLVTMSMPIILAERMKRVRGWFPRRCAIEILDDGFGDQAEMDGNVGTGDNSPGIKKDK